MSGAGEWILILTFLTSSHGGRAAIHSIELPNKGLCAQVGDTWIGKVKSEYGSSRSFFMCVENTTKEGNENANGK